MNLEELVRDYKRERSVHVAQEKQLREFVDETPFLKEHRDYIEAHAYGFGERCFHGLWYALVDSLPDKFAFLEIGVYKGQVVSLIKLIASKLGKDCNIVGITPLSNWAGRDFPLHPTCDYYQMIVDLHNKFDVPTPLIIEGFSQEANCIEPAFDIGPYDIVYIDGSHDYRDAFQDIQVYSRTVKEGGYLVIDDACCGFDHPWGWFSGIQQVTQAVDDALRAGYLHDFEEVFSVVHNRVFKRHPLPVTVNSMALTEEISTW